MKVEKPQEGKWRLIYNIEEDHYNMIEAEGTAHTPSTNTIEYFNSEEKCIERIEELKHK